VTSVDGKLYALGAGWDRIFVGSFPTRHDRIGVGLLFHLRASSSPRERRFSVRIETPSNAPATLAAGADAPVTAVEGAFSTGGGEDVTVPFALQLDGLPLEAPGRYAVVVTLDGVDVKTLAFGVALRGDADATPERPATGTGGYL
jgi:hypothetical protein